MAAKKISEIRRKVARVPFTHRKSKSGTKIATAEGKQKRAYSIARRQIKKGRPGLKGHKRRVAVRRRVSRAFPFGYVDTV